MENKMLEVFLIFFGVVLATLALCLFIRWMYSRRNKHKFLNHLVMINYSGRTDTTASIKGFTSAPYRSSVSSMNNRLSSDSTQRQSTSSIKLRTETVTVQMDPPTLLGAGNRVSKSPFVLEVIREYEEKLQEIDTQISDSDVNLDPQGSKEKEKLNTEISM